MKTYEELAAFREKLCKAIMCQPLSDTQSTLLKGMLCAVGWVMETEASKGGTCERIMSGEPIIGMTK